MSCLRRLELLALEDKARKKHKKRQQQQDSQKPNGDGIAAGFASDRQLALVEMKLQVTPPTSDFEYVRICHHPMNAKLN